MTHTIFDVMHSSIQIYDPWRKGAKLFLSFFTTVRQVQTWICCNFWHVLSPVCRTISDKRVPGCVRVYVCVCVFIHECVCTVVKVAEAVGENQPAGCFEASVSFHFQKKNLAAANLILLLQGKRGPNQSERLKDRWTERERKARMFHIGASLFSNTAQ